MLYDWSLSKNTGFMIKSLDYNPTGGIIQYGRVVSRSSTGQSKKRGSRSTLNFEPNFTECMAQRYGRYLWPIGFAILILISTYTNLSSPTATTRNRLLIQLLKRQRY
ncbi:hypothetical protein A0J61_03925 [Choanephora cucurbitarum]|uniref:Uncharacterized protein n=1 Tax=Choanephora cucurbitarum TaxID=101091 RepID=A0A1C7NFT8_9FUNG|nr:hypothetical protein A0J61_03925 [Choanephora cucurbitarum]